MGTGAPDFSDIDEFVESQQKESFGDIDDFVAQQAKGAPASSSVTSTAATPAPVTLNQRRGGYSGALPPATPVPTVTERLGEMVPQSAVPALTAAKKYAVDPFEKAAAATEKAGGDIVEGKALRAVPLAAAPDLANRPAPQTLKAGDIVGHPPPFSPEENYKIMSTRTAASRDPLEEMRQRFPITFGIARGAGEMVGSTAGDPRNWPFFAAGAARPLPQKIISRGFAANVGASTIGAAKDLYQNWDNLTPAERAQKGTETGIGALIVGAALHPKVSLASSPEVTGGTADILGGKVGAGVAVTPESVAVGGRVGPFKGVVRIPRNGAPPAPGIEAPIIEGQIRASRQSTRSSTEFHGGQDGSRDSSGSGRGRRPAACSTPPTSASSSPRSYARDGLWCCADDCQIAT